MDILVSYLTRKRSGDVAHRDVEIEADVIRLGRGSDCQVNLHDPRVAYSHAEIHDRGGSFFIEAMNSSFELLVNGTPVNTIQLHIGDKIVLGPYEIVVIKAPSGKNLAFTVELLEHRLDYLERLNSLSRTTLADAAAGMRGMSWAFFIVVFSVFLAWPLVHFFGLSDSATTSQSPMQTSKVGVKIWPLTPDLAWISGDISAPHRFVANDCKTCHQRAFVQVEDGACLACHSSVQHHADPVKFPMEQITEAACQSCHKEHNGAATIVTISETQCADCHRDLKEDAPDTTLINVSNFGTDHPQFRPTVVVNATTGELKRQKLDKDNWPVEHSNLKFTHKKHLAAAGMLVPGKTERKVLQCDDCHRPEPGGVGMAPITMQTHCAECHQLKFEPAVPSRVVPHGDVAAVKLMLTEFYGNMALRGGADVKDAPDSVRRRPGTELTEAEQLEAMAWADQRAGLASDYLFGKSVCRVCHEVSSEQLGASTSWSIENILVADRWLPKGQFDHGHHRNMTCVDCHEATNSDKATDVILPQIAHCQQCHGGESASNLVPTTCNSCHEFHQPFLGSMRPMQAAAAGEGG